MLDTTAAPAAAPAFPHDLPMPPYCHCCGCVTRYCNCRCCCQRKAADHEMTCGICGGGDDTWTGACRRCADNDWRRPAWFGRGRRIRVRAYRPDA